MMTAEEEVLVARLRPHLNHLLSADYGNGLYCETCNVKLIPLVPELPDQHLAQQVRTTEVL